MSRYFTAAFIALTANASALAASTDFDLLNESDATVVLTATRLRQSIAETPASVTVITADMLSKFGIRSIPEALRLVPGMAVTQVTNNDYRISYHGTNIGSPRRMNVLIDGLSVYRPTFALVNWTALPVSIEDIQRIEVTRGSNSASYGPNSMLAIINIITKHPKSVEGGEVTVIGGTNDSADAMARYAGSLNDSTTYRMTLSRHQQGKGVENISGMNSVATNINVSHDASRIDRLNFRSTTEISSGESFDFQVAALNGIQQQQFADDFHVTYPDVNLQEYDINAVWRNIVSASQEYKVQATVAQHNNLQSWTDCLPTAALLPEMGALWRANPAYVISILKGRTPTGGTATDNLLALRALKAIQSLGTQAVKPTCGTVNQDYRERRVDLELQSTHVYSDALRLVSGIGARQDMASSQTYLNGTLENSTWRAFANAEYKPVKNVVINAGGYYESDNLTGTSFSPRLAVNGLIDDNNTVRLVFSRANRMPNLIEKRADWSYLITDLTPPLRGSSQAYFAQASRTTADLEQETILSRELGYSGNFPQFGLMVDAKVFDDSLSSLISQRLQLNATGYSNQSETHLRGAEFQVEYQPSDHWTMHLGYSFLLNDSSSPLEQTLYSKNSGTFAISHALDSGWQVSLGLYKYDAGNVGQSAFGKQDLTFSKKFKLSKDVSITPSITASHLDSTSIVYTFDAGKAAENRYPSQNLYSVGARINF